MQRVSLQPAFILHMRPYRESSYLLDLLSLEHGRVRLLAKGFKKKPKNGSFLQPFTPFLCSWQGKTELMNLQQAEPIGVPRWLLGQALICGFYVNEILLRVLHGQEACPRIFAIYEECLNSLQQSVNIPATLRCFEKHLLAELGYGLLFTHDCEGRPVEPTARYQYLPARGFALVESASETSLIGQTLIDLDREVLESSVSLRESRWLLQHALAPLLGAQPLKSRECII